MEVWAEGLRLSYQLGIEVGYVDAFRLTMLMIEPARSRITQSCSWGAWHKTTDCNRGLLIKHSRWNVAPGHNIG